jgi:hypothetical protein
MMKTKRLATLLGAAAFLASPVLWAQEEPRTDAPDPPRPPRGGFNIDEMVNQVFTQFAGDDSLLSKEEFTKAQEERRNRFGRRRGGEGEGADGPRRIPRPEGAPPPPETAPVPPRPEGAPQADGEGRPRRGGPPEPNVDEVFGKYAGDDTLLSKEEYKKYTEERMAEMRSRFGGRGGEGRGGEGRPDRGPRGPRGGDAEGSES